MTGERERSASFEAVYRDHRAYLHRVAFLLTGSNSAAEDAVHDVFVRCESRLDDLDHPLSYLRTAVVNECRTQHRRRQRDRATVTSDDVEYFPDDVVEKLDALDRLDPRKRAAIVLRYFVDLPDGEIAAALRCRPSTVRSLIRRALIDLREVLQ